MARFFVEIKGQLHVDATDGSLLQNLLFAQHVSGTIMPIIMSSRVLYRWLLPVVLGALVFRCGAVGWLSGLRVAQQAFHLSLRILFGRYKRNTHFTQNNFIRLYVFKVLNKYLDL